MGVGRLGEGKRQIDLRPQLALCAKAHRFGEVGEKRLAPHSERVTPGDALVVGISFSGVNQGMRAN